jgi:hypothetical protein
MAAIGIGCLTVMVNHAIVARQQLRAWMSVVAGFIFALVANADRQRPSTKFKGTSINTVIPASHVNGGYLEFIEVPLSC